MDREINMEYSELVGYISLNLNIRKSSFMLNFDEDLYKLLVEENNVVIIYGCNKRLEITKNSSKIPTFKVKITNI